MNELHIQETMTSLQIAEVTSKLHKDVLRAIREMEPAWEKISGRKFALANYTDGQGKPRPCYSLTKTECLYIATKFNDEARAKLILRWEEPDKSNNTIHTYIGATYGVSISTVINAISRCTETTAVTLTRE